MKSNCYLDDCRTPIQGDWNVVRTYDECVSYVILKGLENIGVISLDHDLGEEAMIEYSNSLKTGQIDYDRMNEKTGYDVAKFLVAYSMDNNIPLPQICVHSFNPVGSANIISYINNYLKSCGLPETCVNVVIPHKLDKPYPFPTKK